MPSDVYAMYQSVLYGGQCLSEDLLWKNCPPEEKGNIGYLMDVIDWDANVDPDFSEHRMMVPQVIAQNGQYCEEWICYRCDTVSAKRLTVMPGHSVVIRDEAAYGMILIEGYGQMNGWPLETPTLIHYGALTHDEYFVSDSRRQRRRKNHESVRYGAAGYAQALCGKPGAERMEGGASGMMGKTEWMIPDGYINATKNGAFESHEAICVLNLNEKDAKLDFIVYFEDRGPMKGFAEGCPAQRTRHIRLDKLSNAAGRNNPARHAVCRVCQKQHSGGHPAQPYGCVTAGNGVDDVGSLLRLIVRSINS